MSDNQRLRCAVLFSGRGSNLNAIAEAVRRQQLAIDIAAAITNQPASVGLQHALTHALPIWIIDPKQYTEKQSYEQRLAAAIDSSNADLIILAGFMRILSSAFVERYTGRLINLHPSLLPKYRGLDTHQRALDNHDSQHGASVHFVTPELDAGPVIAHYCMAIDAEDDALSLAQRLAPHEHRLLLAVIALFASASVSVSNDILCIDDQPLVKPLLLDQTIHWNY